MFGYRWVESNDITLCMSSQDQDPLAQARSQFASTHWSAVLEAAHPSAPGSREALETLCCHYWPPVYAFVRRRGYAAHDAQDLVQEFFARLLEKNTLALADPERGRFRTFLLASIRNFLANEWDKAQAQKRGGGIAHTAIEVSSAESRYSSALADHQSPDRLYERQWAVTLLDRVMALLREEQTQAGKERQFEALRVFLAGRRSDIPYSKVASKLGMSDAAAMTAVSRLRRRYRELLRSEVAQTIAHPEEVDDEIGALLTSLGQ